MEKNNNEICEFRFETIEKQFNKIDEKLCDHESRIQAIEKTSVELFTKIDDQVRSINQITKVLWFVGSTVLGSVLIALMNMILN